MLTLLFDRLMGDPCSGFALAVALHIVSGRVLLYADRHSRTIRSLAAIVAILMFLALVCAGYLTSGPDWIVITPSAALRTWVTYSAILILASLVAILIDGLRLTRSQNQQTSASRPMQKLSTRSEQAASSEVEHVSKAAPTQKPPPTLEEKAAVLRTRFARYKEEIGKMPIPDDEKEARIHYLREQLDEQLNTLFEDAWS